MSQGHGASQSRRRPASGCRISGFPVPARESRCLQGNGLSDSPLRDSRTHEHELRDANISCVTTLYAAVLIELYLGVFDPRLRAVVSQQSL